MKKKVLLPKVPMEEESISPSFSVNEELDENLGENNDFVDSSDDFVSIDEDYQGESEKDTPIYEPLQRIEQEECQLKKESAYQPNKKRIKKKRNLPIIIGLVFAMVAIVVIASIIAFLLLNKKGPAKNEQVQKEKTTSLELPINKNEISVNKITLDGNNIKLGVSLDKVSNFSISIKTDNQVCATPILYPDEVKGEIVVPCKTAPDLMKLVELNVEDF